MECKHYKGDGYGYDIGDGETLYLCDSCNMNLAGEIAKQAMLMTFLPRFNNDDDLHNEKE